MEQMNLFYRVLIFLVICVPGGFLWAQMSPGSEILDSVIVFDRNIIHFTPDEVGRYDTGRVVAEDRGRVITTGVSLPDHDRPVVITAHLAIHPIPKDEVSVYDPWDRAGNIRLSGLKGPDIELVKFVTAYGGFTEYEVDISHLAPLLRGNCTIKGFIDTWISPGWKMDFKIVYMSSEDIVNPRWVRSLVYSESYRHREDSIAGLETVVEIPDNIRRVKLLYLVSGHCTDGSGADEFVTKDNVIYVDNRVVYRFQPWRDDCRAFRDVNPYTRRWSNGYWSSDFSRSGWCPGDIVYPLKLDLTDHLGPGRHTVKFVIEDVRPADENGHFGYWRLSGYLLGWPER